MEAGVTAALIGAVTTGVVAIGGWAFAWGMQRETKARDRLRKRVAKLEQEVRARMAVEEAANDLIAELTQKPRKAIMLQVRDRAHEASGLRPEMSPSELTSAD